MTTLGEIMEAVTEESLRDVYALAMAFVAGDRDGQDVVLGNCDPQAVAAASVYMTAATLTRVAHIFGHCDGAEVPFIRKALAAGLDIEMPGASATA